MKTSGDEVGGRAGRRLLQTGAQELYVEMIVVNDLKRIEQYAKMKTLHEETLHVVNLVNLLFRKDIKTPVTIVVKRMYDAKDPWKDEVPIEADGEAVSLKLLDAFTNWRTKLYDDLPSHDSAHLFSGHDFDGETVGLANQIGDTGVSICSDYWCGFDVGARSYNLGIASAASTVCVRQVELLLHGLHWRVHGAEREAGGGRDDGGARDWPQIRIPARWGEGRRPTPPGVTRLGTSWQPVELCMNLPVGRSAAWTSSPRRSG